jgi:hypothetical protein
MEVAIGVAASLGHSSSLAMNAIAMTQASTCVTVNKACTSYPCDGAVTIALGPACPLPLGGAASGTIQVSGTWQSSSQATLKSTTYTSVQVGGHGSVVTSASNLSASSGGVVYTGQDAVVQGGTTLAAQSSWDVTIGSDGKYSISGTQQGGSGSGAASQLSVSGVVLDPACTLNPVAGNVVIQDVGGLSVSQANITFHHACDGKAEADGKSVSLNFFN